MEKKKILMEIFNLNMSDKKLLSNQVGTINWTLIGLFLWPLYGIYL